MAGRELNIMNKRGVFCMSKFIYVFSVEDRDYLLAKGYKQLKSNEKKNIYIFENSETMSFSTKEIQYVLTDILSF